MLHHYKSSFCLTDAQQLPLQSLNTTLGMFLLLVQCQPPIYNTFISLFPWVCTPCFVRCKHKTIQSIFIFLLMLLVSTSAVNEIPFNVSYLISADKTHTEGAVLKAWPKTHLELHLAKQTYLLAT